MVKAEFHVSDMESYIITFSSFVVHQPVENAGVRFARLELKACLKERLQQSFVGSKGRGIVFTCGKQDDGDNEKLDEQSHRQSFLLEFSIDGIVPQDACHMNHFFSETLNAVHVMEGDFMHIFYGIYDVVQKLVVFMDRNF